MRKLPAVSRSKKLLQRKLLLERLDDRLVCAGFGPADGAYFVEPWIGYYTGVAIQSDQQILVAGSGQQSRLNLARYDGAGNLDPNYGTGGLAFPVTTNIVQGGGSLVIDSAGRAVAASSSNGSMGAQRFNTNGSYDLSFGSGGTASIAPSRDYDYYERSTGIGLQSDGSIVVGGSSRKGASHSFSATSLVSGFSNNGVLKSGPAGFGSSSGGVSSGFAWNSFGAGAGHASFISLVVQPDNKIVASGVYSNLEQASIGMPIVARFTSDGLLDTTFNGSGYSIFSPPGVGPGASIFNGHGGSLALQPDGKIVVTSAVIAGNGKDALVARYLPNGTLDTGFGGGLGYTLLDVDGSTTKTTELGKGLALLPDGKILVVCDVSFDDDSTWAIGAFRLNVDGSRDGSFGGAGFKIGGRAPFASGYLSARNVAVRTDGSIVVAGSSRANNNDYPMLMRFFDDSVPTAIVTPTSGLVTSEVGGQSSFTVKLDTQPSSDVTYSVTTSDITEGTVSTSSLTFTPTNWNLPQTVTVTGVNDVDPDGNVFYTIVLGAAVSADLRYNGLNPTHVTVTNTDNDTKFYVVNDATANLTYEYTGGGAAVENYSLNSGNTAPRGAASTIAGDKVWVVDENRKVYIYNPIGTLLGSWTAGSLANNSQPQGIATNGVDVWIVDSKSDKVFKYAGAATRLSGSQNATNSFNLDFGNANATDIVTDGASLWVVNDSSSDKVFKYTIAGGLVGSWAIDPANASPTGITIDPANVSNIWIVDSGTDKIYQYNGATIRTSQSSLATFTFALAAGNTNPQGIADPPTPDSPATIESRSNLSVASEQMAPIDFAWIPLRLDSFIPTRASQLIASVPPENSPPRIAPDPTSRWLESTADSSKQRPVTDIPFLANSKTTTRLTDEVLSEWGNLESSIIRLSLVVR